MIQSCGAAKQMLSFCFLSIGTSNKLLDISSDTIQNPTTSLQILLRYDVSRRRQLFQVTYNASPPTVLCLYQPILPCGQLIIKTEKQNLEMGPIIICQRHTQQIACENSDWVSLPFSQDTILTLMFSSQAGVWTCSICFEETPGLCCLHAADCCHYFCTSCLKRHVQIQLEESRLDMLTCPDAGCKEHLIRAVRSLPWEACCRQDATLNSCLH